MVTKRSGRSLMGDHIESLGMCRLTDLKKGDRFYENDWDDESVYELLDLAVIHGEEDDIEYYVRKLGNSPNHRMKKTIHGTGVVNRHIVCKYKGRDRGSYLAGFRAAMSLYQKYMQDFDKENAGLSTHLDVWLTMNTKFHQWKKG